MNDVMPKPMMSATANAIPSVGAAAIPSVAAPSSVALTTVCPTPNVARRAIHNAPSSEPTLSTENMMVNTVGVLENVSVTSSGITTWKLSVNVLITAVITSGSQRSGVARTYCNPSRI